MPKATMLTSLVMALLTQEAMLTPLIGKATLGSQETYMSALLLEQIKMKVVKN
jgi:hypothetical protein